MRVTVLCGGFGGARLAMAMNEAGLASGCTFVTNVADDCAIGALLVCPDTDAVLYGLAGRFDDERGWGIRGDVFPGPEPGEPSWFNIGAADRRHHRHRRALLDSGATLSAATRHLARGLGCGASVVPVTDGVLRTRVRVGRRWLSFQEWLIRSGAPQPDAVALEGAGVDVAAPGVLDAIREADLLVLASSSPIASLDPILTVGGVREALRSRRAPTVALSPMVLGLATSSPRDSHRATARARLMAARGLDHDPLSYARWLDGLVSHVVLDESDSPWAAEVASTGVVVEFAPVIGATEADRSLLVQRLRQLAAIGAPSV